MKTYSVRVIADDYQPKLLSFNLDDIQNADLLILMTEDANVSVPPNAPYNPRPDSSASEQPLEINIITKSFETHFLTFQESSGLLEYS